MNLDSPITAIKGVGDKIAGLYHKLNIYSVGDLLLRYPKAYMEYESPIDIGEVKEGDRVAVLGTIASAVDSRKIRSFTIVTCKIKDFTGTLRLSWFNMPYLRQQFHMGQSYVFVGDVTKKGNQLCMEHPQYFTKEVYEQMMQTLQPVYSLTEGLSNKVISKHVKEALPCLALLPERLPEAIVTKYDLMSYKDALKEMHFPTTKENVIVASKRIAFDEFFYFLISMERLKEENLKYENPFSFEKEWMMYDLINGLPYHLTGAQKRTIQEIVSDMQGESLMNRLVQGDVGSGKTVVAMAALVLCATNGYQGALMAPTEVLATQHKENFDQLLSPLGIRTELLVGSMSMKEKRKVYEALKNHEIDILIGTHALIQDKVVFDDLALVVTDEQHRFGVKQRAILSEKGNHPHVLVMSATPIPRTLAIIMYGDLDISIMNDMPANRLPIKNCVIRSDKRAVAYNFIKKEVANGHQCYVICPMVEESEKLDVENVVSYTDTLKEALPSDISVAYLHGKMNANEKLRIMEQFHEHSIDVLVSTTVIEVGIDQPNATVIMIENAERFGMAQLHQLRGRVGRGSAQSYCIMVQGKDSKEATERLSVLENSNDGFFIANEDLRLRGPGDFFGIRQSGDMLFSFADIYQHADALKDAMDAIHLLKKEGYDLEALSNNDLERYLNYARNI